MSVANRGEGAIKSCPKKVLYQNRDQQAKERARKLRKSMTDGERILWGALRRGATGFWFRRQFPSGPYVMDFYCAKARLCVEIDGECHNERVEADARRDAYFSGRDIETLRIESIQVFDNLDGVIDTIVRACQHRTRWTPPGK